MRKEHIYSKLICGALLLFGICVPVCAQTGHLSGVRVINDEILNIGREIHVDFVLDGGSIQLRLLVKNMIEMNLYQF